MRIKLFTHTDMDGVGCTYVLNKVYGKENVDSTYCNYDDIDLIVASAFTATAELMAKRYDMIYITDISVNEEVASLVDAFVNKYPNVRVRLLDHHTTALELNKYPWATVLITRPDGKGTSGTSMLYEELLLLGYAAPADSHLQSSVEMIRLYDTWEWKSYGLVEANQLNNLFYFYGKSQWLEHMTKTYKDSYEFLTDQLPVLYALERSVQRYIDKISNTLIETTVTVDDSVTTYSVGVVFAEQHISELGNALHEMNTHLDLIMIVNASTRKVSFRTTHDHIDVSQFAKNFGGGGRQKTAGAELSTEPYNLFLNNFFANKTLV